MNLDELNEILQGINNILRNEELINGINMAVFSSKKPDNSELELADYNNMYELIQDSINFKQRLANIISLADLSQVDLLEDTINNLNLNNDKASELRDRYNKIQNNQTKKSDFNANLLLMQLNDSKNYQASLKLIKDTLEGVIIPEEVNAIEKEMGMDEVLPPFKSLDEYFSSFVGRVKQYISNVKSFFNKIFNRKQKVEVRLQTTNSDELLGNMTVIPPLPNSSIETVNNPVIHDTMIIQSTMSDDISQQKKNPYESKFKPDHLAAIRNANKKSRKSSDSSEQLKVEQQSIDSPNLSNQTTTIPPIPPKFDLNEHEKKRNPLPPRDPNFLRSIQLGKKLKTKHEQKPLKQKKQDSSQDNRSNLLSMIRKKRKHEDEPVRFKPYAVPKKYILSQTDIKQMNDTQLSQAKQQFDQHQLEIRSNLQEISQDLKTLSDGMENAKYPKDSMTNRLLCLSLLTIDGNNISNAVDKVRGIDKTFQVQGVDRSLLYEDDHDESQEKLENSIRELKEDIVRDLIQFTQKYNQGHHHDDFISRLNQAKQLGRQELNDDEYDDDPIPLKGFNQFDQIAFIKEAYNKFPNKQEELNKILSSRFDSFRLDQISTHVKQHELKAIVLGQPKSIEEEQLIQNIQSDQSKKTACELATLIDQKANDRVQVYKNRHQEKLQEEHERKLDARAVENAQKSINKELKTKKKKHVEIKSNQNESSLPIQSPPILSEQERKKRQLLMASTNKTKSESLDSPHKSQSQQVSNNSQRKKNPTAALISIGQKHKLKKVKKDKHDSPKQNKNKTDIFDILDSRKQKSEVVKIEKIDWNEHDDLEDIKDTISDLSEENFEFDYD